MKEATHGMFSLLTAAAILVLAIGLLGTATSLTTQFFSPDVKIFGKTTIDYFKLCGGSLLYGFVFFVIAELTED